MLSFPMVCSTQPFPPHPDPGTSQRAAQRPIISPATLLKSTLPTPTASIHSKSLTATRFPLESTLTKNPRGRGQLLLTTNPSGDLYPERPSRARDLSAIPTRKSVLTSVAKKDLSLLATTGGSDPVGKRVCPEQHVNQCSLQSLRRHLFTSSLPQSQRRLTHPNQVPLALSAPPPSTFQLSTVRAQLPSAGGSIADSLNQNP